MKNMGTHVKVQKVKTQDLTVQWTIVAYRDFLFLVSRLASRLFLVTEVNNRLSYYTFHSPPPLHY